MSRASLVLLLLFCLLATFGAHANGGEGSGSAPEGLIRPGSTTRCFATFTAGSARNVAIRNTCAFVATAYVWVADAQGAKRWRTPGAVYLVPRASVETGFERTLPLVIEGCPGRAFPVKTNGAAAADGPPSPYLCHP